MSGLYLHIPFCRRKCPYCDFYSRDDCDHLLPDYHRQLIAQLQMACAEDWQAPFSTVFFGGGTPSLLKPAQVAAVLDAVAAGPGLTDDAEISFEANPATLNADYLRDLRATGVNRLSLGVQSLDNARLQELQRLHDAEAVYRTVEQARTAGFSNLSCDLMFALPGQKPQDLALELERLLSLQTEHVSIYGLGIEPETPWGRLSGLQLPEQEDYAAMYELLHGYLSDAGYRHYEISNFARPGRECRHNLGYWRRSSCLGLGAGAHSFSPRGWGTRRVTVSDLEAFRLRLEQGVNPMEPLETFDRRGAMAETAYLGLRTAEGVDGEVFRRQFGCAFEQVFAVPVKRLAGSLRQIDGAWCFDWRQWLTYDCAIAEFL